MPTDLTDMMTGTRGGRVTFPKHAHMHTDIHTCIHIYIHLGTNDRLGTRKGLDKIWHNDVFDFKLQLSCFHGQIHKAVCIKIAVHVHSNPIVLIHNETHKYLYNRLQWQAEI